jgi:hypothetical protein
MDFNDFILNNTSKTDINQVDLLLIGLLLAAVFVF